jgi:competence protein ComEA
VAVVVAGGYWLTRAPTMPTESILPVARSASTPAPAATLPAPARATPAADATDRDIVVHVAGAVVRPGVYQVGAGARVNTAIEAAGGSSPEADLDGLNLAALLVDGQRIYVPIVGEIDPAAVPVGAPVAQGSQVPTGPLDLNVATVVELDTLPGVGPATAAAIVDDRDRNGPFASVDDLERVPGIGPAKLASLRDLVSV